MFANAMKYASIYTKPVIISQKLYDGKVECSCASFIILNEEGWILTSAHVLNVTRAAEKHKKELSEYEKKKAKIKSNKNLNNKEKTRRLKKLSINDKWIVNQSYWWGKDKISIKTFAINELKDLAAGKLEPFDNKWISVYPTFKNPDDELLVGTSLCRLGFPLHDINATYDEDKNTFTIAQEVLPLPRFPIEGIHTRVAIVVHQKSKKKAKFIETSSPGLRGQSGGPIFDIDGNIWGLQCKTSHYSLGFSPKVKYGSKEVEEHQFINVGLGTHVEEIVSFLKENNIKFNLSAAK